MDAIKEQIMNPSIDGHGEIVARSEPVRAILDQLKTIALSDSTVLLIGETGVGKERFAEYIHEKSARRFKPLVRIGVSTLPHELIESELFGHEKGAFTGAAFEKKGLFEVAHGGTLLLDDIDDLPIDVQPKLLRAMESRQIQRVGGTRTIQIDVRFVATTKVSLKDLVDRGKFRADLFYRLHVVPCVIPPLRDRREDIPPLIEHYLKVYLPDKKVRVSKDALRALVNYSWPGNVRELINVLVRVLLFVNDEVTLGDLPPEVRGEEPLDALIRSCNRCFMENRMSFNQIIECLERNLLQRALELHNANKTKAAAFLGLKLSTFRDKISKYSLTDFR